MNIILELTEEDIKKLTSEKSININTQLVYKENKIDDLSLFMKVVKDQRKIN